jgi:hypothetical protein
MPTITDAELNGEIEAIKKSGDMSDRRLNRVLTLVNNVMPYEKRQRMLAKFSFELGLKTQTGESDRNDDADAKTSTRVATDIQQRPTLH